jgi:hypothetical protein
VDCSPDTFGLPIPSTPQSPKDPARRMLNRLLPATWRLRAGSAPPNSVGCQRRQERAVLRGWQITDLVGLGSNTATYSASPVFPKTSTTENPTEVLLWILSSQIHWTVSSTPQARRQTHSRDCQKIQNWKAQEVPTSCDAHLSWGMPPTKPPKEGINSTKLEQAWPSRRTKQ